MILDTNSGSRPMTNKIPKFWSFITDLQIQNFKIQILILNPNSGNRPVTNEIPKFWSFIIDLACVFFWLLEGYRSNCYQAQVKSLAKPKGPKVNRSLRRWNHQNRTKRRSRSIQTVVVSRHLGCPKNTQSLKIAFFL